MGMKSAKDRRFDMVREAVAKAIANEVDAVEDVVGYVSPNELLVILFDIAIKYGRDSSVEPDHIEYLFHKCVDRRVLITLMLGPIAEA